MANISQKVRDRISSGIKKYSKDLVVHKNRDLNESDTVRVITDMLCDVFGYERYSDITTEHPVKSTYCDLGLNTKIVGLKEPKYII